MSHTDKDRPYWVQTNDPTLPRYASHGHYLFGRTRTRWHLMRDNHGRPLMEDVTESRWFSRASGLPISQWSAWQVEEMREDQRKELYYQVTEFVRKLVYETREIAFADHCTIDEPNVARSNRYDQPCSYELDGWVFSPYGPRGGTVEDRRLVHSGDRRQVNDSLRNYVKEVNGADTWDDLDDSDLPGPPRRHSIYWW